MGRLLRGGLLILIGWFTARVIQRKRAKDQARRGRFWRRRGARIA